MLLYGFIVHFRSTSLAHVNSMLREQLDQATDANRSLTQNIDQLNDEVRRSQEELDTREAEWRDEEKVSQWYLKAMFNNVSTFTNLSCVALHAISVFDLRCKNEALKKLYFGRIIKCSKRLKIDKWPDLHTHFSP